MRAAGVGVGGEAAEVGRACGREKWVCSEGVVAVGCEAGGEGVAGRVFGVCVCVCVPRVCLLCSVLCVFRVCVLGVRCGRVMVGGGVRAQVVAGVGGLCGYLTHVCGQGARAAAGAWWWWRGAWVATQRGAAAWCSALCGVCAALCVCSVFWVPPRGCGVGGGTAAGKRVPR